MTKRIVTIYLDDKYLKPLEEYCEKNNYYKSNVICFLIERFVKKNLMKGGN